jgi:hypothetical protein
LSSSLVSSSPLSSTSPSSSPPSKKMDTTQAPPWFASSLESVLSPLLSPITTKLDEFILRTDKRHDDLAELVAQLQKKVSELENKSSSPSSLSLDAIKEEERLRSIVVSGLPFNSPQLDQMALGDLLHTLGMQCTPCKIFRLGTPHQASSKPPLLKVVLPSSSFKAIALSNLHSIRRFPCWKGVSIRPSETLANRQELSRLIAADPSTTYVIHRDQVMKASDRPPRIRPSTGRPPPRTSTSPTSIDNGSDFPMA